MGEVEITRFDSQAVRVDDRRVLRLMGYPQGARVAPAITDALGRAIPVGLSLAEPIAVHKLHEVQSATPEAVHLAHGVTFRGQRLAQAMRHARQAAILVVTLGERVTEATRELAGEDPFESYLLDSVASILVETVADRFQTLLEERMNQQRAWGGFRYSPGYCDWPTEENRALLHTIDAQSIGVRLTTGGMMSPPKTISGIIPYGVDPEKIHFNSCTGCSRTECDHRRS